MNTSIPFITPNKLRLKPGTHIIASIKDLDDRERIIALICIAAACLRYGIPVLVACACRSMEIFYRRALGDSAVIAGLASNNASVLQRSVHFLEEAAARGAALLFDAKQFQLQQFINLIMAGELPGVTSSSLSIVVPVLADNVSLANTAKVIKLFPDSKIVFQAIHPEESKAWHDFGIWNWPQRENRPVWDFHKVPQNSERFIIRGGEESGLPPVTQLPQFLAANIDNLEEIDALGIKGAIKYLESACEPIYRYLLADITRTVDDTNHESNTKQTTMDTDSHSDPDDQSECASDDDHTQCQEPTIPHYIPLYDSDRFVTYANEADFQGANEVIDYNNIPPIASHVAAPGSDYGSVEAWPVSKYGSKFLVRFHLYYDGKFAYTDNINNLGQWILGSETDPAERANLLNEPPETVDKNHNGPCSVILAVKFDSSLRYYCWLENSGDALPFVFASKSEAHEWIFTNIHYAPYSLVKGETSRPDAFVVMPYKYQELDFASRITTNSGGSEAVELLGEENGHSRPMGWCLAAVSNGRIQHFLSIFSAASLTEEVEKWKQENRWATESNELWLGLISRNSFVRPMSVTALGASELEKIGCRFFEPDFEDQRDDIREELQEEDLWEDLRKDIREGL